MLLYKDRPEIRLLPVVLLLRLLLRQVERQPLHLQLEHLLPLLQLELQLHQNLQMLLSQLMLPNHLLQLPQLELLLHQNLPMHQNQQMPRKMVICQYAVLFHAKL